MLACCSLACSFVCCSLRTWQGIHLGYSDSAKDAGRFMDEGACLVQVYSGLVFRGPELAREVAAGLAWRQRAWA